jgi:two-component system chemotaxis response regulator CheY
MANIMIVDDSKFMRNILRDAVESGGHTVVAEADNGTDALALYDEHKPDLTTMDITIHGKDGIQVINEIIEKDSSAKILVVSALSETTVKNTDNNLAVQGFITKPFVKEDLINRINSIV